MLSFFRRRTPIVGVVTIFSVMQIAGAETTVIPLWPEGVPGLRADASPEYISDDRVYNVHQPSLTFFPACPENVNGMAVIVCPGGGYARLAVANEGHGAATWLNSLGVSVFLLKYRLKEYGHPAPLRDVLRAMRVVRSRAAEFGLDPERIGIFGSSAGGHLAACASTLYDHPVGRTGDSLDAISARPDFVLLQYPVITMKKPAVHEGSRQALLGENADPALVDLLSVEQQVTGRTPPTFIVATQEDKSVPVENALLFYQALRKTNVPVQMHLYTEGAHGFGFRQGLGAASDWPKRAEEWMRDQGLLQPAKGKEGGNNTNR